MNCRSHLSTVSWNGSTVVSCDKKNTTRRRSDGSTRICRIEGGATTTDLDTVLLYARQRSIVQFDVTYYDKRRPYASDRTHVLHETGIAEGTSGRQDS